MRTGGVLYARQICNDADDVVQQAFLKLADQKSPPDEPAAWLHRVVRNEAFMVSRSLRRRKRRETEAARHREAWFQPSESDAMDSAVATEALAALPGDQREIVTAHIWGGLSFNQVGQLLGISDSTAHRRYHEAIEILRQRMGLSCR